MWRPELPSTSRAGGRPGPYQRQQQWVGPGDIWRRAARTVPNILRRSPARQLLPNGRESIPQEEVTTLIRRIIGPGGGPGLQTAPAAGEFPPERQFQNESVQGQILDFFTDAEFAWDVATEGNPIQLWAPDRPVDVDQVPHGVVNLDYNNSGGHVEAVMDTEVGRLVGGASGERHGDGNNHMDGSDTGGDGGAEETTWEAIVGHISSQQTRYLVIEIYVLPGHGTVEQFLQSLQDPTRRLSTPIQYRNNTFYAVAEHDTPDFYHVHSVHVCTWTCSSCRCGRLDSWRDFPLRWRKAYPIRGLDVEGIRTIVLYHLGRPKLLLHCEVAGQRRRVHREDRTLLQGRCSPFAGERVVALCHPPQQGGAGQVAAGGSAAPELPTGTGRGVDRPDIWDRQGRRTDQREGRPQSGASSSATPEDLGQPLEQWEWDDFLNRISLSRYKLRQSDLVIPMKRYLNTPINAIPYSMDWLRLNNFSLISHSGLLFDGAVRRYRGVVNCMTLSDLYTFQTGSGCMPVYSAGCSDNIENTYWPLHQSLFMLLDLLHYQYRGDFERVKVFLRQCCEVIEKRSGKKNSICIVGPANSGKNFFVDGLCDFCLNPGKMENPQRNNNFAFASCHNRRIIKWDECSFDRSFDEIVLNMLQGKTFLANIKYRNAEPVHRTPVFIMANTYPFVAEERFNERIHQTRWQRCERLKRYREKQPLPLAHGVLLLWCQDLIDDDTSAKINSYWRVICEKNT